MARSLIDIAASGADGQSVRTLLTCVAKVLGRAPSKLVVGDDASWARALQLAVFHGVSSIVYQGVILSKELSASCPPAMREWLRLQQAVVELSIAAQVNELDRIRAAFSAKGVESLTVKGVTLGALAYSPPHLRRSGDMDVLVRKSQYRTAAAELIALGYEPVVPDPVIEYAAVSTDEIEGLIETKTGLTFVGNQSPVDLHWTLDDFPDPSRRSWFPFSSGLDPEAALMAPAVVEFQSVELKTLQLEDLVLYLCFHGAKHSWSRLTWIADIAALSQKQTINWGVVYKKAVSTGSDRLVNVAVLLAVGLLGAKVPKDVLQKALDDLPARLASRLAAKTLFAGPKAMHTHVFRALAFRGAEAKKTYLTALVAKRITRRSRS
ncbi:MAG: nucleotidyltransferase family protein [Rhodothermia bacterium]|nr:nucleotidyltransferase family protein [Rhodothermia bacterium]